MRESDLQDRFLELLQQQRVPVSIYLVNGIKLQGTIDGFDRYMVSLKNVSTQAIYKHAISTVSPSREVRVPAPESE